MESNSIQRFSTVETVLDDIREKIILNQYQEGVSLAENTLAKQYGVSRGTIRVAFQALEKEGLILVQDNGRKLPLRISEKFVRDLYDVRSMLECEAIRLCMNKQVIQGQLLSTAFSDFYNLYTYEGDELYRQRSVINTNFHRAIIATAENRPLFQCWSTIEPMVRCITKLNCFTLNENESNESLVESHRLLMDVIFKKDNEVYEIIQNHIYVAIEDTLHGLLQIKR